MKNFYIALAVLAAGGIAVLAMVVGGSRVSAPVDLGEIEDNDLVALAQGVVYGDPDAPVTIMEFGDYQCPACRQFGLTVKPQIDLAYIQDGMAKLVFHDFPLPMHPHSFVAARAARCAGDQELYFEYHDLIFRTQDRWSPMSSAVGHFKDLAEQLGLDTGAFGNCLDSDRHADVVTANIMLGQRLGVSGTPSIFVHSGQGGPATRLGGFQFIDIQQTMDAIAGS